jgi:hypothetical protein
MMNFDRGTAWCAAFLFLAGAGLASAETLPAPAIIPGAKLVMGVRVNHTLAGISDLLPPDWQVQATSMLSSTPLAGFDPFTNLDEVVISSTGEGTTPPALAWLRGQFPVSELAEKAIMTSRGVPLIRVGPNGGAIAFPDATTAIAGEETLVRAALDRMGNPGGELDEQAARLRSKYDVWGFATKLDNAGLPDSAADTIKALDGIQFGASFSDGLDASIRLDVHSSEDMAKLTTAIVFLETMMKAQSTGKSTAIQMHSDGRSIQIGIVVPREEWKKALLTQREAVTRAVMSQLHGPGLPPSTVSMLSPKRPAKQEPTFTEAPTPAYVPPPPPQPKVKPVTKIYSDDDGGSVIVTLPGHK